jgi:hypothetical protein
MSGGIYECVLVTRPKSRPLGQVIVLKKLAEPSKRVETHQFPHSGRVTAIPQLLSLVDQHFRTPSARTTLCAALDCQRRILLH